MDFPANSRPTIVAAMAQYMPAGAVLSVCRRRADVRRYLARVGSADP